MNKVRLASHYDTIYLGHLENLLRHAGIEVEKRNHFAVSGMGELPAIDVMPELWVEEGMFSMANAILQQLNENQQQSDLKPWVCPACGERIEGQFSQCWQCGHWLNEGK